MNSATAYPLAEADAARLPCGWEKRARGTPSDLAAAPHLPLTASAGRGPSTTPPGDNNPARTDHVAAHMPGGGEPRFCVVAKLPANPLPEEPQWSRHTTRPQSSIASATCSKRVSRSRKSARLMVFRADRLSGAGVRAMMNLPAACGKLARSAILPWQRKAWPWLSRLRSLLLPIRRPLASHSTLSGGSWANSRSLSATSPSLRGQ